LWFTVITKASEHGQYTFRDDSSTNQTDSSEEETLSAEAIANITATVAAIGIIASVTCYLCYCFNHKQRMERIKAAIERNRVIRQRIAAEKAAAAQTDTNR